MIAPQLTMGRQQRQRAHLKENFADWCDRQELRLQQKLARPTPSQRLRRRSEAPTKGEIINFGNCEARGNTCHAMGDQKNGC